MFAFYREEDNELIEHAESILPCPNVGLGHKHEPHEHKSHRHMCLGFPTKTPVYTLETSWPWAEANKPA